MVSATASGASPKPFSRSAETGKGVASTIVRACARASSRVIAPSASRRPSVNAKPALVVASASKPSPARIRAVPTSQGLGMTKAPARRCRAQNAFARSVALAGIGKLPKGATEA